ncbi:hypothetical protein HYU08_00155 [Candidatus Woesearchaeota archaeon]|nr:hypothetical protein [Candidatus Woesearchaeota archaeon]
MKKEALIGLTALLIGCANQNQYKTPEVPPQIAPKQYNTPEEKIELAQCLVDQEAYMFGAYWCPACYIQEQEIFGPEAWEIFQENHYECSERGSDEDKQRCMEIIIEDAITLPTWKFKDGTTVTGYQTLETLAKLSKCD